MAVRDVVPTAAARRDLPKYLKAFRRSPTKARPAILGPYRRAEAVLLPVQQYEAMIDRIEELSVRAEIADVLANDTGKRGDIAALARKHGFDPAEFGLG